MLKARQLLIAAAVWVAVALTARAQTVPPGSVLVLYNSISPTNSGTWVGGANALMLANLLGHFDLPYVLKPIENYQAGDLQSARAAFYLGTDFYATLPAAFTADVFTTTNPLCWFKYHIWNIGGANFESRFGFRYLRNDSSGFSNIVYKGETFLKDQTDKALVYVSILNSNLAKVPAIAAMTDGGGVVLTNIPYVVHASNLWYVADNPFNNISDEDRYVVFCDLLHDILGINHAESHRAIIRIEDVSAGVYTPQLIRQITDLLHSNDVPFALATIPVWTDPLGYWSLGTPVTHRISDAADSVSVGFRNAICYAVTNGGQIIIHGYTHQYNATNNPGSGVSGDDYEFWRKNNSPAISQPVPEDSVAWVSNRLSAATNEMTQAGFNWVAWETPHYLASALDNRIMATNFSLMTHRGYYFAAEYDPSTNGTHYTSQFFPYTINRDTYGCKLIPENLGYYSPVGSATPRLPADMIRVARKNLVVRDGWANAYFHGFLPLTNLQAIVTGIKALGYDYVQLSPGSPPLRATVTLTNLAQTYDGAGKCASATTAPAGLGVNLIYDGSAACPTNAGVYTVIGTISEANYQGSATNTLSIGKAPALVNLSNLTQAYTGGAITAVASTVPSNLVVNLTYDGSAVPPTNAGSYTVIGTVSDANYQGGATNTLVIGKAAAPVNLTGLTPTYDGAGQCVAAATIPDGLVVNLTYDGVPACPTNAGSYTVVGAVSDANYQGGTTNPLTIGKATATVSLSGLARTYTGGPIVASATTTPPELPVNLTYNGSAAAPTNAGSYTVIATINAANHQGGATNTLVIAAATATVTVADLTQTFDGAGKCASATTAPAGLGVNLIYDGSAACPTNAGVYTVIATVGDTNFTGSATNTLSIGKAPALVTLNNLTQTYTGGAITVAASTVPSNLVVNLTYAGSVNPPTNAGSYTVIGTVSDANYQGGATNALVIGKAAAAVNLTNLLQSYTGNALAVGADSIPAGLTISLTYDGSAASPTNAGSYTVIGTVSDANYQGGATNTFIIGKATAAITLTNLVQTYTGNAITAAALTAPAGLTVNLAYDGSASAPTNAGTYTVIGTISEANYQGSATNTLSIGKAPALVTLNNLTQTYTGGAITAVASTVPSNLVLNLTYNGSAVPPTNAGSYTVVATVSDANYQGGATNTLVVGTAGAAVNLSGLIHTYDGTGKCASAQTTPIGLVVNLTYDGSAACPTNPGSYTVIGTINDVDYRGGATNILVINCPSIALGGLTNANLGVAYSQTIAAAGGAAPYSFTLTGGVMPTGLSLGTNGNISGLPLALTTNNLTVTATDANGCSGSQGYTLKVTGTGPVADTNRPTVIIVSPASNSTVTNASRIVSGTASDNVGRTNSGVAMVFLSLNGGPQQLTTGRTNWTATVTLIPGTNTLIAQAVDFRGNVSRPATNKLFYALRSVFTVVTNGVGSVVLAPAAPVYVGRNYTFTLAPGANTLFSNIVNEATGGVTTSINSNYVFRAETTNRITINFVTNRFIKAAGNYQGLFSDTLVNRRSAGAAVFQIQSQTTYSGTLFLNGDRIPLAGRFNLAGENVSTSVLRTGKGALSLALQLNFDDTLSGVVSSADEGWTAYLDADRSVFGTVIKTNPYAGTYTLAIPGRAGDTNRPAGDGFIYATISSAGAINATVDMSDGQALSVSSSLSKDGRWPFFLNFSSSYKGMIMGWLQFSNHAPLSPVGGDLFWINEGGKSGYYNRGFTNSFIPAVGSTYVAPAEGRRPVAMTNALLVLADGNLSQPVTNGVVVTAWNQLQTTNGTVRLFFAPATGSLTGTFNHPVTGQRGVIIKGIYVQGENQFHGYFLGTNQSGSVNLRAN